MAESFDIVAFIKDFGFPIAACVAMFVMLMKVIKNHKEEVAELKDAIYDLKTSIAESAAAQNKEMTTAINNNTIALQRLTDKIGNG